MSAPRSAEQKRKRTRKIAASVQFTLHGEWKCNKCYRRFLSPRGAWVHIARMHK